MQGKRNRAGVIVLVIFVVGIALAAYGANRWWPVPKREVAEWAPQAKRFNVLVISLDTTRRDHLSCYGYERATTPHLDALARDGMLFKRCVATSNWTLPSHASMFTGLYPDVHGARLLSPDELPGANIEKSLFEGRMRASCRTLAETLSEAGYRTGAIVANFGYFDRRYQLDRGFEHYDARRGAAPNQYRSATEITAEAIRWIDRHKFQRRPFFLFLNYMDPHHPYNPPPEYVTQFTDEHPKFLLEPKSETYFREQFRQVIISQKPLEPYLQRWMCDRYDGEIAYMDAEIGRLIARLNDRDLYDETIILVTADHGEALGEHNVRGHRVRLHEPEVAVPMIVKMARREETGPRQERVSHIDVMPTILELVGIPIPDNVQGRSMLHGEARDLVTKKHLDVKRRDFPGRLNQHQWALYRGPLKYIEYSISPPELFNLEQDPGEENNLAADRPDDMRALKKALAQWRTACQSPEPFESAFDPQQSDHELHVKQLKDLGYSQ